MVERPTDFLRPQEATCFDGPSDEELIVSLSGPDERDFLSNYLKVREEFPEIDVGPSPIADIDWLFAIERTLEEFEIDPSDMAKALDLEEEAANRVCLRLMELLVERDTKIRSGATHVVARNEGISDGLVHHLAVALIDAFWTAARAPLPRELIVLIRQLLGGARSAEYDRVQKKLSRQRAIEVACEMQRQFGSFSMRGVAQVLDVEPSTVSRWFPDENFGETVNAFLKSTDEIRELVRGTRRSET
ncbi:hypothetical protein [Maricaulis sp. CAU 1757]